MNKVKRFLMIKGVEIFTNHVSRNTVKVVFLNVDFVEFLNGLQAAARRTQ
jgi:hypothetical protein